jgi:hypothetical protein
MDCKFLTVCADTVERKNLLDKIASKDVRRDFWEEIVDLFVAGGKNKLRHFCERSKQKVLTSVTRIL